MAGPVRVLDDYYLAITLLVTIAYQLFFFSIAFSFKFDKLTGECSLPRSHRENPPPPLSLPLTEPADPSSAPSQTSRAGPTSRCWRS